MSDNNAVSCLIRASKYLIFTIMNLIRCVFWTSGDITVALRRRKEWKPESNGLYTRNLGWKLDHRTGRYSQHKFYLGTDLKQAERRRQRLEELWELIEQRAPIGEKPTWTSIGLKIAKALARG